MRKLLRMTLAGVLCTLGFSSKANVDTTIVVAHKDTVIQTNPNIGHTEYPAWTSFPAAGTSYRRVMLQLKFECAPGLMCGEWDYINNISIGRVGGVNGTNLNYEIARMITPYGKYWTSASNWNHTWYFDVTDFAPLLHDSVEIIYQHTGYEAKNDRGWKINTTFMCVKGTPVREPIAVNKLWSGSFRMGDTSNPVESHLPAISKTLDANTNNVRIRLINTGHGNDSAGGCMEFCARYRNILWDNQLVNQKYIWRGDCGSNPVYPQAGTWIYDRGGWCPGSAVRYDDQDVLGLTGGTAHTVNMDMEPYIAYKAFGNIYTTGYMIEYKGITSTVDATLENIVAPSSEAEFKRLNPICNQPIIVIRNSGSSNLTSATIKYGISGGAQSTFNWTGNLKFMEIDTVVLTNPVNWGGAASGIFTVDITNPNGTADQFVEDNSASSQFISPKVFPSKFVVKLTTNKTASEYYYKIMDVTNNTVIFQKGNFANNKTYSDTIALAGNGCYQFYFGCDGTPATNLGNKHGLEFWAFDQYLGKGQLEIVKPGVTTPVYTTVTSSATAIKGGDFGTSYSTFFTTAPDPANVASVNNEGFAVETFPNPTTDFVSVDYTTNKKNSDIELYDVTGKLLKAYTVKETIGSLQIDLRPYAAGVYYFKFKSGENNIVKKVVKQ